MQNHDIFKLSDNLNEEIGREELENYADTLLEAENYYEKYQTNKKQCIENIKNGKYKKNLNLIKKILNEKDLPLFGILKFHRYFVYTCLKISEKLLNKQTINVKNMRSVMQNLQSGLQTFEQMINLLINVNESKQKCTIPYYSQRIKDNDLFSKEKLGIDLLNVKQIQDITQFYVNDLMVFSIKSLIVGYLYHKQQKNQQQALFIMNQIMEVYKTQLRGNIIENEQLMKVSGQIFMLLGNIYLENQNFETAVKQYEISLEYFQKLLQISLEWFSSQDTKHISVKKEVQCERIVQIIIMNLHNQMIAYENLQDYNKTLECVGIMEFFSDKLLLYEQSIQIKQLVKLTKEKMNEKYKTQIIENGEINHILKLVYPLIEYYNLQKNNDEIDQNYWDTLLYEKFNYKELNNNQIIVKKSKQEINQHQKQKQISKKCIRMSTANIRAQSQVNLGQFLEGDTQASIMKDSQSQNLKKINMNNSVMVQKSQSTGNVLLFHQKDKFKSSQTSFTSVNKYNSIATAEQSSIRPFQGLTVTYNKNNISNNKNKNNNKILTLNNSSIDLNNTNKNKINQSIKSVADFFMNPEIDESYQPKILLQNNYFNHRNNKSEAKEINKHSLSFFDQKYWHLKLDKKRDYPENSMVGDGGSCLEVYFREEDQWCDEDVQRLDREMKQLIEEKFLKEDASNEKILKEKYQQKYYRFLGKIKEQRDDKKDFQLGKTYLKFKNKYTAFHTIKPKSKNEIDEDAEFIRSKEIESNERQFHQQHSLQSLFQNQSKKSESEALKASQQIQIKVNLEQRKKSLKNILMAHKNVVKLHNLEQLNNKIEYEKAQQISQIKSNIQKQTLIKNSGQSPQNSNFHHNYNVHHFISVGKDNSKINNQQVLQSQQKEQEQTQQLNTQDSILKKDIKQITDIQLEIKKKNINLNQEGKQKEQQQNKLLIKIKENYLKNQNIIKKYVGLNETEKQNIQLSFSESKTIKKPEENKYYTNKAYLSQFFHLAQNLKNFKLKSKAQRGKLNMSETVVFAKFSNLALAQDQQKKKSLHSEGSQQLSKRHQISKIQI